MKEKSKQRLSLEKYLSLLKQNSSENRRGNKIYIEKSNGKYYEIRTWVSYVFFIIFVTVPFININGKPIFLFNFFKSEYIIYGQIFKPEEFYFFGLTLILFTAFILLFTSIFGRVFCGWICPQTVFMEMLFRKIEFIFNKYNVNENTEEIKDKLKFNTVLKHITFLAISFLIANILLMYIIGYEKVLNIIEEPLENNILVFLVIVFFSLLIYYIFSFYRQNACINFCPYSRLQNVLFDKNTLLIAYDFKRGEPRGVVENDNPTMKIGECIDCRNCVKVCPMGIDIRNGIQRECIMCTSCIDACSAVMYDLRKTKSLIKFTSENLIENGVKPKLTNRARVNFLLMAIISAIIFYIIFSR
ncbi:MAG: 4Fe-4S binding protein [Bacteroidia bacterium]|nr:4Fe-4S binding protein [Bacteroidia bacterium]